MNRYFSNIQILIFGLLILVSSCKKDNYELPTLTTAALKAINTNNAISGGNISDDGGAPIVARGVCWSTNPLPTIENNHTINGEGIGEFVSRLTDLNLTTQYYVRAYATNCEGTAYGDELVFTTNATFVCGNSISDYEGNIYPTITIGYQCWLQKNLTTSNYNDGTPINTNLSNNQWLYATEGAFATYGNDELTNETFGKLYNWHAISTEKLCPEGWHIPSEEEWIELTTFLGGEDIAGGKMKTVDTWQAPNTSATNRSGFSGLPGGYRFDVRISPNIGYYGNWWSSTANGSYTAIAKNLSYSHGRLGTSTTSMVTGLSCRCVKD